MRRWLGSGRPWVWLTAGAVSLSLLAMLALVSLLVWQSMRLFWPQPVYQLEIDGSSPVLGELVATLNMPQVESASTPGQPVLLFRTGSGAAQEYSRLPAARITDRERPIDALIVQRHLAGKEYGFLQGMLENGQVLTADDMPAALQQRLTLLDTQRRLASRLREQQRVQLGQRAEQLQQQALAWQREQQWTPRNQATILAGQAELQHQQEQLARQLAALDTDMARDQLVLRDIAGQQQHIALRDVELAWFPNAMSLRQKLQHTATQIGRFISQDTPDYATGTAVFPALVGTLLLVILMAVMVMPLGVMAAVYLHEYAGNTLLTRIIRIAVSNLAGVPSIVYGIFGLGFFVYILGGSLDKLFYADSLPAPTFGTPGLLWAALTLALLTLPVVIIATEEGLAQIPAALRQGSLALGATQAETLWRVVLPGAAPAMMTGLILAVARAAGETAPLMLVGVIKSAPTLPVDGLFPWLHADRQFMHLGFQIYDMAMQSPDGDAVRPLVFATALLLILLVVALNLAAMGLRHRLREKYRALTL